MSADVPYPDLPTDPEAIFDRILDWRKRGDDLTRLYHQLRAVAPVWRAPVERLGRPWVVTRHADAIALLREARLVKDERVIGLSGVGAGGPFIEMLRRQFAFVGPPRHTQLRGLVNRAFTRRSVDALRPAIVALVDDLLDALAPRGRMDVVADYAAHVPVAVICQLLGAPVEDVPRVADWSATFSRRADEGEVLDAEMEKRGDEATLAFADYVQSLLDARRRSPSDDLLTRLLEVQRDDPGLTDADIVATSILLFQAGWETTANLIAKATLALLRHPEEYARLGREPALAGSATEELLRYDTSVQLTTKFAAEDIAFHGRTIREGEPVSFVWAAINRDPARFPDPDRLDLSRKDVDHHSFGMGANFCLGARLARLEIEIAMGALARRLPALRLETDAPVYKPQLHLHGLASLPVSWPT